MKEQFLNLFSISKQDQNRERNRLFIGSKELNGPTKKLLITFCILFLFKLGTSIPLSNIDNQALKKSFLEMEQNNNYIIQALNMYASRGGKTILSPFSLGIIPFINASILIDLLTALFPKLEKLQSDESGRQQITFYKKILTFFLSLIQSYFLLSALKNYLYLSDSINFFLLIFQLVIGSLIVVWFTTIIDTKGIGNGTSLFIFTNIVSGFLNKNLLNNFQFIDLCFFLPLIGLICISQMTKLTIPLISARQLAFLESNKRNKFVSPIEFNSSALLIKFNQAGIFPIIIASNIIPIISYILKIIFGDYEFLKIGTNVFYYFLIIIFNYFYTTVFWDPEKISEQLRKSSVSLVNVTPGKKTIYYLENVVRSSSIVGGILLGGIIYIYDFFKQNLNTYTINQINVSSLIILVGVTYELQRMIRGIYKTVL